MFGTAAGTVTAASTMLAALTYTNTISAGVLILTAIVALGTVAGVIRGARFKSAYLAECALRQTIEADRDELKEKLDRSEAAARRADQTIARLEALPNMAKVLELVTQSFERLVGRQEAMHIENKVDGDRRLKIVLDEFREDRRLMLDEIRLERTEILTQIRNAAA